MIDRIRKAVSASGKSRNLLSRESGVATSQVSRLIAGKAGIGLANAERLADALGLEIVLRPKRKGKAK